MVFVGIAYDMVVIEKWGGVSTLLAGGSLDSRLRLRLHCPPMARLGSELSWRGLHGNKRRPFFAAEKSGITDWAVQKLDLSSGWRWDISRTARNNTGIGQGVKPLARVGDHGVDGRLPSKARLRKLPKRENPPYSA